MVHSTIEKQIIDDLVATTDMEFVKELIDAYLDDSPVLINEMKTALQDNDAATFRRAAHTLKSSSASLGVLALSEISKELEQIGKAEILEQVDGKLDRLISIFEQAERELRAF
ncbi:MAG: Hpt domain-containing protein [Candidatus Hermodarchaeia archaeon]|jgi:HPt (histidine-containing phosphotransfer) domain-containing protein